MGGFLQCVLCLHFQVVVVLNRASSLGVSNWCLGDVSSLGVSIACESVGKWFVALGFLPRFNSAFLCSTVVFAEGARFRSLCVLVLGWVTFFALNCGSSMIEAGPNPKST